MNTAYDILLYLRSQGKLPIENLHLVKFPEMLSIDIRMSGLLRDVRDQVWGRERDDLLKSMSTAHQSLARHDKNRLMWQNELDELNEKLGVWDSDVQFDLSTKSPLDNLSTSSSFAKAFAFTGYSKEMAITETVYPFDVDAPDLDGMWWDFKKSASAANKTWNGKFTTKWTKTPRVSVRSYTTNKTRFADKIDDAKSQKDQLTMQIGETMQIIANHAEQMAGSESSEKEHPRVAQLTDWLARGDKLIKRLEEIEVPFYEGFNRSAQRRYVKPIDKVGKDDLIEFVGELDPALKSVVEVALEELERRRRL